MAHAGSWSLFGYQLPDYGITEAIGGLLGSPTTAQGGSNIIGGSSTPNYSAPQSTPQVLGTSVNYSAPKSVPSSSGGGKTPSYVPQQNVGNPFQGLGEAAKSQAQIELESALADYDRLVAEAEAQKVSATGQKESALSDIYAQEEGAKKRAGTLTQEAEESRASQTEKALTTSQDVVRKNRNILRAMGILSSSAGGEMLARPTEEYATQAADLRMAFNKRKVQVEDWLTERLGEADRAKNDIVRQFNEIIGAIDRDIRFTGRDKAQAVRAANASLQQNIAQLNYQAMQYQQAAQQYNQNMAMQLAQLQLYQNPSANISQIMGSLIQTPQTYKPITVGTLQPEKDLLSSYTTTT